MCQPNRNNNWPQFYQAECPEVVARSDAKDSFKPLLPLDMAPFWEPLQIDSGNISMIPSGQVT